MKKIVDFTKKHPGTFWFILFLIFTLALGVLYFPVQKVYFCIIEKLGIKGKDDYYIVYWIGSYLFGNMGIALYFYNKINLFNYLEYILNKPRWKNKGWRIVSYVETEYKKEIVLERYSADFGYNIPVKVILGKPIKVFIRCMNGERNIYNLVVDETYEMLKGFRGGNYRYERVEEFD